VEEGTRIFSAKSTVDLALKIIYRLIGLFLYSFLRTPFPARFTHMGNITSHQIFGKIGNLQTKSWKLREESGDLPVQLLSNKCQYFSSDLHATRASHIMLLELIVDRFVEIDTGLIYSDDPEMKSRPCILNYDMLASFFLHHLFYLRTGIRDVI
jgi:hypothetical protein